MKNKRITAIALFFAFLISSVLLCFTAFADDTDWSYDENTKTLRIFGNGEMNDYSDVYSTPWSNYVLSVESLVVEDGVTSVGNNILSGAIKLCRVELADSVASIGASSFASCPSLLSLTLGENISSIDDVSFAMNGASEKSGFVLNCDPGTYAFSYAVENGINYNTEYVKSGLLSVALKKGMKAYYPYTPKVSGTFRFYSVSYDDTRGYVYDSSLNRLAYNDDHSSSNKFSPSMSSVDFALTVNLEANKTYYFATDILNPSIVADYTVFIEAYEFIVSGSIYAMKDRLGNASDLLLTDAKMNGQETGGTYTFNYTAENKTAVFTCGPHSFTYEFSPDSTDVVLVMCDYNNDRVVNGKDYYYMMKDNSPYLQFFDDLVNYRY